ncbi:MAG: YkgJ family cysteine cluster protein [archaeon]
MTLTQQTPRQQVLKLGSDCKRCGHCCSFGSAFVLPEEIESIAKHLKISPEKFKEKYLDKAERFNTKLYRFKTKKKKDKPYGPCIFLKFNKTCKIHDAKPLFCRIGTCKEHGGEAIQWYDLNHNVNTEDPQSIREWAIFVNQKDPIPGGKLEDLIPDKKTLKKILEYDDLRIKKPEADQNG